MARGNGRRARGNNQPVEKPYFDQLAELFRNQAAIREQIKEVSIAAKEAGIPSVVALKASVRRYLEPEEQRHAREDKEAEIERILRALGEFVKTPLGQAAVSLAEERDRRAVEEPEPPEAAA